jgi:hypothetical protein
MKITYETKKVPKAFSMTVKEFLEELTGEAISITFRYAAGKCNIGLALDVDKWEVKGDIITFTPKEENFDETFMFDKTGE